MNPSSRKGNNPELWDKFLNDLDERLQFGLLEPLRRINSYHFEGNSILIIEPGTQQDFDYLTKPHVSHQLQLLASGSTKIEKIEIKKAGSE
jgi:hypothetical protein